MDAGLNEFKEFCRSHLLGQSSESILKLLNKRCKECDSEFKLSEEFSKLLSSTKSKILNDQSRFFIHLRDFLAVLKTKRRPRSKHRGDENGQESGNSLLNVTRNEKRRSENQLTEIDSDGTVQFERKRRKIDRTHVNDNDSVPSEIELIDYTDHSTLTHAVNTHDESVHENSVKLKQHTDYKSEKSQTPKVPYQILKQCDSDNDDRHQDQVTGGDTTIQIESEQSDKDNHIDEDSFPNSQSLFDEDLIVPNGIDKADPSHIELPEDNVENIDSDDEDIGENHEAEFVAVPCCISDEDYEGFDHDANTFDIDEVENAGEEDFDGDHNEPYGAETQVEGTVNASDEDVEGAYNEPYDAETQDEDAGNESDEDLNVSHNEPYCDETKNEDAGNESDEYFDGAHIEPYDTETQVEDDRYECDEDPDGAYNEPYDDETQPDIDHNAIDSECEQVVLSDEDESSSLENGVSRTQETVGKSDSVTVDLDQSASVEIIEEYTELNSDKNIAYPIEAVDDTTEHSGKNGHSSIVSKSRATGIDKGALADSVKSSGSGRDTLEISVEESLDIADDPSLEILPGSPNNELDQDEDVVEIISDDDEDIPTEVEEGEWIDNDDYEVEAEYEADNSKKDKEIHKIGKAQSLTVSELKPTETVTSSTNNIVPPKAVTESSRPAAASEESPTITILDDTDELIVENKPIDKRIRSVSSDDVLIIEPDVPAVVGATLPVNTKIHKKPKTMTISQVILDSLVSKVPKASSKKPESSSSSEDERPTFTSPCIAKKRLKYNVTSSDSSDSDYAKKASKFRKKTNKRYVTSVGKKKNSNKHEHNDKDKKQIKFKSDRRSYGQSLRERHKSVDQSPGEKSSQGSSVRSSPPDGKRSRHGSGKPHSSPKKISHKSPIANSSPKKRSPKKSPILIMTDSDSSSQEIHDTETFRQLYEKKQEKKIKEQFGIVGKDPVINVKKLNHSIDEDENDGNWSSDTELPAMKDVIGEAKVVDKDVADESVDKEQNITESAIPVTAHEPMDTATSAGGDSKLNPVAVGERTQKNQTKTRVEFITLDKSDESFDNTSNLFKNPLVDCDSKTASKSDNESDDDLKSYKHSTSKNDLKDKQGLSQGSDKLDKYMTSIQHKHRDAHDDKADEGEVKKVRRKEKGDKTEVLDSEKPGPSGGDKSAQRDSDAAVQSTTKGSIVVTDNERPSTSKEPQASTSKELSGVTKANKDDTKKVQPKKGSAKQIERLEKLLQEIRDKIEEVRNRELSLDELDSEVSDYILEDRLQQKFVKVWKKLCELHEAQEYTGRPTEKAFKYEGTRYPDINRKIERFINKRKVFPDYHDIRHIIKHVDKDRRLHLTNRHIDDLAKEAFSDVGNQLQKRRQKDFVGSMRTPQADVHLFSVYDDPALVDPALKKKLDANRKEAKSKMEKVMEKYAHKQHEVGDHTDDGEDSSESDDAEPPAPDKFPDKELLNIRPK